MKPIRAIDVCAGAGGAARVDRLPPHSVEAEQALIGCILLSPNDCMGECIEKLKPGSLVFYDLRHRTIFEALAEMFDEKQAVDLVTLRQHLKDTKRLESVGGLAYLASLPDAAPSASGVNVADSGTLPPAAIVNGVAGPDTANGPLAVSALTVTEQRELARLLRKVTHTVTTSDD